MKIVGASAPPCFSALFRFFFGSAEVPNLKALFTFIYVYNFYLSASLVPQLIGKFLDLFSSD